MKKVYQKKGYRKTDIPFLRTIALIDEYVSKNYQLQFGHSVNPINTKNRLLRTAVIKKVRYFDRYSFLQLTDKGYEILKENGYEYIRNKNLNHTVPAIKRRGAVAKAAAFMYGIGVDIFGGSIELENSWQSNIAAERGQPVYYSSKEIKDYLFKKNDSKDYEDDDEPDTEEEKSNRGNIQSHTSYAGILDSGEDLYCVYSINSSRPKFSEAGEMGLRTKMNDIFPEKIEKSIFLTGQKDTPSAVFLERDMTRKRKINSKREYQKEDDVRRISVKYTWEQKRKEKNRKYLGPKTDVYESICIIPNSQYGQRMLRIMMQPNWRDRINKYMMTDDEYKPHGQVYHADGVEPGGTPVINMFDMDVTRLKYCHDQMLNAGIKKAIVLCYKDESDIYVYEQICEMITIPPDSETDKTESDKHAPPEMWAKIIPFSINTIEENIFGIKQNKKKRR